MNTAQQQRLRKESHPAFYCMAEGCLWRTGGIRGTPCEKHPALEAKNRKQWAKWVAERENRIIHDVTKEA